MLKKLHERAVELGWRCLADAWFGAQARYAFECAQGHRFERNATAFLYRSISKIRCEECEATYIRERFFATVAARGGAIIEGPLRKLGDRYRLRCEEKHEWETTGYRISRGSWCPQCARAASSQRNRLADGLAKLRAIAHERGGQCLATAYTRGRDRYEFECSHGHRWTASGAMALHGHWCPHCAGIARRLTLEAMQALAAARGGVCLSTEYVSAHLKLVWQCHRGHVWQALPANVKNKGRWCPNCAILRSTKSPIKRLKWDVEGEG